MISKEQINDILLSANLINVIEETGVKLKKSGAWLYNGICPFHNEKDGSFYVNTRTNTYKCYGCGAWGNAIDFLIKRNGLTFLEAARKLAGKYNIAIEEFTPTKEQEAEEKLKNQLLNIYEDAAQFYSLQLEQNTKALKYVRSRFDDETVDGFRIGFAPDEFTALYRHLRQKGYSMSILEKSELFRQKDDRGNYDFFRNRILFPIFDITGRVIAFSGRTMPESDENLPKYINSSESVIYSKKNVLFGLNFAHQHIRQEDTVIIVEGYADVIKLHQLGILNVVASCGTAFTDEQIRLLGKATRNFCLLYDSDPAGQAAAEKNGKRITESGYNAYVLTLPNNDAGEKQDPDTFFHSAEHFQEFYTEHRESFLLRFTKSKSNKAEDPAIKSLSIKEIASLFYKRSESERLTIVDSLSEILKPKNVWLKVIKELEKEAQAELALKELSHNDRTHEQNVSFKKYGFYEEKNCYYFYAPKTQISLPFSYEKAVNVFSELITRQNSEVLAGNEVSDFWNVFQELFSNGLIENKYDLLIKEVSELRCKHQNYTSSMTVLFMNPNRIFSLYAQTKKNNLEKKLPKDTLLYYLQNSDEYLGLHQVRFKKTTKNLQDKTSATIIPGDGTVCFEYERPNAWCFDYDKLVERTGLNLDTEFVWEDEIKIA